MKILLVNRTLFPVGGVETYVMQIGDHLKRIGHEVQYFGMDDARRMVGNNANAYVNNDNGIHILEQYYSRNAQRKIKEVLIDFRPDVVHLNNFHYGITPTILSVIDKWRRINKINCKIVYTAHDFHLLCPNHMCYNTKTKQICDKCLTGNFSYPISTNCIDSQFRNRALHSFWMWYWRKIHKSFEKIDAIVCCSEFIKTKYDMVKDFSKKTITLHNYISGNKCSNLEIGDYIIYFGRYKQEKGIRTLIKVAQNLPSINFVFAGDGPLAEEINSVKNINNVGFQCGAELKSLIQHARFSILASELYENCPFSVIESQMYGVPVLGADIGGIPELIQVGKTGELFESGNANDLEDKIKKMWNDTDLILNYKENCKKVDFDTIETYCEKLLKIYRF